MSVVSGVVCFEKLKARQFPYFWNIFFMFVLTCTLSDIKKLPFILKIDHLRCTDRTVMSLPTHVHVFHISPIIAEETSRDTRTSVYSLSWNFSMNHLHLQIKVVQLSSYFRFSFHFKRRQIATNNICIYT